jgi:hypothetical protein
MQEGMACMGVLRQKETKVPFIMLLIFDTDHVKARSAGKLVAMI